MLLSTLFTLALTVSPAVALSIPTNPYTRFLDSPDEPGYNTGSLTVDLGYEIYEGRLNTTTNLNTWLGIRYAASPTGSLRWQKPQPPAINRDSVIQAVKYTSICYQAPDALIGIRPTDQSEAAEDCLFLNIWAPSNPDKPLPVFVWIHEGGYGTMSGRQDLSLLINTNNNAFIGVTLQYRLGAFGFLSSDEVYRFGAPNAGLYDQHAALQWVQRYIHLFGGDPTQVTIGGLSAGGGSVMHHATSYGGTLGTSLFKNTFAASPYLALQYAYDDWAPTQAYNGFAIAAGCSAQLPMGDSEQNIFQCLQGKSADRLANASATVSQYGAYGTVSALSLLSEAYLNLSLSCDTASAHGPKLLRPTKN
jgi:carboxylesterase type B